MTAHIKRFLEEMTEIVRPGLPRWNRDLAEINADAVRRAFDHACALARVAIDARNSNVTGPKISMAFVEDTANGADDLVAMLRSIPGE